MVPMKWVRSTSSIDNLASFQSNGNRLTMEVLQLNCMDWNYKDE